MKQVVDAGRLDLSLLSLRSQQHSPLRSVPTASSARQALGGAVKLVGVPRLV